MDEIKNKEENINSDDVSSAPKSDSASPNDFPVLSEVPKDIKKEDLNIIPEDLARKYQMVVFFREGVRISIAMVDPQDIEALNVLRFIVEKDKLQIQLFSTTQNIFQKILSQYTAAEKALNEAVESLESDREESFKIRRDSEVEMGTGIDMIQDAPIAKLVQVIVKHAIEGRASDIHIEPFEGTYRVRYRVDGILHNSLSLPMPVGKAVVARIKILSDLKIDEKRKPQDGRFQVEDNGQATDFRVSTLPVVDGEKVVMRVLDKSGKNFELSALGIWGRNLEVLSRKLKDPFGMILISGPTGSGKSTTLYGFLQILNKEERNIVTLEDPVEYFLKGINQSQIKPEIGYSFANGLRSILRQDPNVIMVGEIRDGETAELAVHAALTGHLIFSTIHTNTAIGSIPRLVDMGIEPFLLASCARLVAGQRLVRKICEHCKIEAKIPEAEIEKVKKELANVPPEELKAYEVDLSKGLTFFEGKGCDECGKLGYKGRMAIFEVLEVTARVQNIITNDKGNEAKLEEEGKVQRMIYIRQDGLLKALRGITTLAEVQRVTVSKVDGGDMDDDRG